MIGCRLSRSSAVEAKLWRLDEAARRTEVTADTREHGASPRQSTERSRVESKLDVLNQAAMRLRESADSADRPTAPALPPAVSPVERKLALLDAAADRWKPTVMEDRAVTIHTPDGANTIPTDDPPDRQHWHDGGSSPGKPVVRVTEEAIFEGESQAAPESALKAPVSPSREPGAEPLVNDAGGTSPAESDTPSAGKAVTDVVPQGAVDTGLQVPDSEQLPASGEVVSTQLMHAGEVGASGIVRLWIAAPPTRTARPTPTPTGSAGPGKSEKQGTNGPDPQ